MVVHGNRPEDLRDLLLTWLANTPLGALENELILVQSNSMGQWLKMGLAQPTTAGGMGISAAVKIQLPGQFLWQAYRALLGKEALANQSPFDKTRLLWRLIRLLPSMLEKPDFAPITYFLQHHESNPLTLFQLARQIADLFDQYQVYRSDWLEDWAHGRDVLRDPVRHTDIALPTAQIWQARLWRALLDETP